MLEGTIQKRFHLKKLITVGVLLFVTVVALAGCSSQKTTETQQIKNITDKTQSVNAQGNKGQFQTNPAVKVAMGIIMIQRSQENVLTSAQSTSIKPLLQALIDASDPTDIFLQQKADAITALFTEKQKSFLTQKPEGSKPPGNGTPPSDANGQKLPDGGTTPNGSSTNTDDNNANIQDKRNRPNTMEPTEIYKQALAALK